MTYIHPARTIHYRDLVKGLAAAVDTGDVNENRNDSSLALYCYTKQCVFQKSWTPITELARGLIIDHANERVVATPFSKFFNVGEREHISIPDLPFETFEKVDGSLIILFFYNGEWRTATKGSFSSDQAIAAARHLEQFDLSILAPGDTWLAEWVSPNNRIVVPYECDELIMLAGYYEDGSEIPSKMVIDVAARLGWRFAKRHQFLSVSHLIEHAKTLPPTEEGFVLRFSNGLRLKVKGDEYRRIHALISRVTPLAMWEALRDDIDMIALRKELPEEFWGDFDRINELLIERISAITTKVNFYHHLMTLLTDKEVGLQLDQLPSDVRTFIFSMRKYGSLATGRARLALFRHIRPTGNRLPGYTPSYAMNRVIEADDA